MEKPKKRRSYKRMLWTGEDIAMLQDNRERDSRRNKASSDDYKNHIDGA
ncbi:MAG: hypothetical protein IJ247_00940 [Bacilli bacterium]|nr:hypothetical protein [Bacilli bacterium]